MPKCDHARTVEESANGCTKMFIEKPQTMVDVMGSWSMGSDHLSVDPEDWYHRKHRTPVKSHCYMSRVIEPSTHVCSIEINGRSLANCVDSR